MVLSIRNISASILLALLALTTVIIVYSGRGQQGPDNPVVGQEVSAAPAKNPAVAFEDPEVVEGNRTVVPEEPQVPQGNDFQGAEASTPVVALREPGQSSTSPLPRPQAPQRGPILLPLNPPYLNPSVEDKVLDFEIEPAAEEASYGPGETEAARPFGATSQMAHRWEDQPDDQQPAEAGEPTQGELGERESPAAEEDAGEEEADESEAEDSAPEEQPSQPAEGVSQGEAPQTRLPEASTPPEPRRELTPAQTELRDRLRRTVAFHRGQAFSAGENTATEVLNCCLAFGCSTEVYRSGWSGKKVNGITCLCWNYPCAGYELLGLSEGRIAPRIGYGLQVYPSQLLAVLALARVKPTYPVRVGDDVRTVADLVEYEKLSCHSGNELSLKLIGLAYYVGGQRTWENSLGEQWSVERIVKEELSRPVLGATCGGTHRLMGLSYALARRQKRRQPLGGTFSRAREFIGQFHDYALKLQNPDGSWGPQFLAARGTTGDQAAQFRSTGHVLEWLAMSLPEDRLDDPRVVRSVEYVNRLLSSQPYRQSLASLSTQEIESLMHALHALVVYDQRFFRPRTTKAPDPDTT
jgi:hypothetical protein